MIRDKSVNFSNVDIKSGNLFFWASSWGILISIQICIQLMVAAVL